MVTLTFVLFGFIALGDLKVNLLPDLSYPTLTVRTEYTGAAPSEIENADQPSRSKKPSAWSRTCASCKSVSRTGQSDVVLEFAWGTDMDQASLEVRDKIEVAAAAAGSQGAGAAALQSVDRADHAPRR